MITKYSFQREGAQRRAILDEILKDHPAPNDLIFISDIDEIPTPEISEYIIANPPLKVPLRFKSNYFYYSFQHLIHKNWIQPYFATIADAQKMGITEIWDHKDNLIPNLFGIHMSYAFKSSKDYIKKLCGFSHTCYCAEPYIDPNYIYSKVACSKDLFERTDLVPDKQTSSISLVPGLTITQYPMLEDLRISFLNKEIPFDDLDEFDLKQVQFYNACDTAVLYLQKYKESKELL